MGNLFACQRDYNHLCNAIKYKKEFHRFDCINRNDMLNRIMKEYRAIESPNLGVLFGMAECFIHLSNVIPDQEYERNFLLRNKHPRVNHGIDKMQFPLNYYDGEGKIERNDDGYATKFLDNKVEYSVRKAYNNRYRHLVKRLYTDLMKYLSDVQPSQFYHIYQHDIDTLRLVAEEFKSLEDKYVVIKTPEDVAADRRREAELAQTKAREKAERELKQRQKDEEYKKFCISVDEYVKKEAEERIRAAKEEEEMKKTNPTLYHLIANNKLLNEQLREQREQHKTLLDETKGQNELLKKQVETGNYSYQKLESMNESIDNLRPRYYYNYY